MQRNNSGRTRGADIEWKALKPEFLKNQVFF